MAVIGKNNNAHVFEIANRVATNNTTDGIAGVANNLANHQSGLNNNAHQIANVFGLQSALDSKANTVHTHNISDVSGLQAALGSKANVTHTHTVSDVTGLQSLLDSKADKGAVAQTLTVVTEVDFVNQTVVTANINIVDGIIVEIN